LSTGTSFGAENQIQISPTRIPVPHDAPGGKAGSLKKTALCQ
jgi:hypothetical protein